MSDTEHEKQIPIESVSPVDEEAHPKGAGPPVRTGILAWYFHPTVQIAMLGFVCFMGPGLFNANNGLGGGGKASATISANGNATLYACFAFSAFFAGSITNYLGPRLTLALGATGYSVYIGSYLATNLHPNAGWFIIFSGALLGICAGLLWAAQGCLMLAYPTEAQKGLYIAIFWSIFNLGGVVGAAVAFGQNIHSTSGGVKNGTYIAFIIIMCIGVIIPFCMADPKNMYRSDGSKVVPPRQPSWKAEFYSLYLALRTDPMIVLLFPLFFASNFFYTWQFNDYNGTIFNIRTRGLNNFCYWTSQIFGSLFIGFLLDLKHLSRRSRAALGWVVLLVMVFVVNGWSYHYQKGYTRASVADPNFHLIDYNDSGYAGYIWLYIFCGFLDAMWQSAAYWFMGAMSNDPAKLAIFSGWYKSLQSAGAAGAWRSDAVLLPYMNIFASQWALLVAGLIFAAPMLYIRVKNHTDLQDEVIARMDEQGHVHDVSEFVEEAK